jgi:hypothetical protein
MRRFLRLCVTFLMACIAPAICAAQLPGLAAAIEVRHTGKDAWRVDYRFSQAVTSIKLGSVGDYRQRAWKVLTPGMALRAGPNFDVISGGGKPFKSASVEITTFDGLAPKSYAPFNRFTDGGTAFFLGHLQGDVTSGKKSFEMQADIRLVGLAQENVIAPPLNRLRSGGERGYAYFGPAQATQAGAAKVLIDPDTPQWARETIIDAGAKVSQYYESAYQRPLRDDLFIMVSMAGYESPGISMKGGAVLGQLSYRLSGAQMIGDHPKKRELLARLVAHEMAHLWQMNIARGGIGEGDPWVHEGGADAMALDALQRTALASDEAVKAYRASQAATCAKLDNSVASYDGIYACGLMRFDQLGMEIVPLWRAMMAATEAKGELYSPKMIETIAGAGR